MSDRMLNEIRGRAIESYDLNLGELRLYLSSGRTLTIESEAESAECVADIRMTLAKSPNEDSEPRPLAPDLPKLDHWIDAYENNDDETEDFCVKAGVDEHGWLCVLVEDGRVLRLRPSQVLAVLAEGKP